MQEPNPFDSIKVFLMQAIQDSNKESFQKYKDEVRIYWDKANNAHDLAQRCYNDIAVIKVVLFSFIAICALAAIIIAGVVF